MTVQADGASCQLSSGVEIAYWHSGSGPFLVQLHGVGLGHWNVSKATPLLSRQFTCIDIDMPGYGESGPPSRTGGIADLADDVADFIREFVGGPVFLHGTSFGGCIAVSLAGRHPDVVDRLVVSVCLAKGDKAAQHRWRLWEAAARLHDARLYGDLTIHSGFSRAFYEREDADAIMEELRTKMAEASVDAQAYLEGVLSLKEADLLPVARQIVAPTLFIGGEEDIMTPVVPAASGAGVKALHEAVDGSKLVIVPRSGHYVLLEHPEDVAKAIADFL